MFQSYLCKLFKKKPAEDTLVPPLWETRRKNVCFLGLFVLAAVRGGTCAFTSNIFQYADQKQLTRRQAFDLEATHANPIRVGQGR